MRTQSRFDAVSIERLATMNEAGRFEIELSDRDGKKHVVSLPFTTAVALGCLICDVSERAPFLIGGVMTAPAKPGQARGQ